MTRKHADFMAGKTIRFAWTEGPTKGSMQDHVLHRNGSATGFASNETAWTAVHGTFEVVD